MEPACCDPALPAALQGDPDDVLATLCKALGHPVRVRLLRLIVEKGGCLSGSLAEAFDLAPSTVSEHLRLLKEAGLVQGTVDGQRRCYCAHPAALSLFKGLAATL